MYPYGNNQFGGYGAPPGQPMSPNPAAPQYANQAFGADPNQPQQFYGQSPAPVNPYGTINTNTITNFGSVYAGDNMGAYASNVGVAANTTGGYNSVAPYATTSFNVQPAGYSTGLSSAPSYSTNSFVNQSVPQGFISDPFGQGSFPSTPINPINSGYVAPVAPPSVDAFTGAFYMNPTDPSTYTTMYIPPVDPQNTFNSNTNAVNNNQQYGASPQQQQQQQQQQQSFVSSPLSVTEELALKEGWMWKFTASTGWVQQYNIIEKSHGGYLLGFPQPPEGGAAPQSLSPLPQSKCTVVGLDEFPWDVQSLNFKDPCVFLFQCFQPPSEDIYFVCDGYDNLMDWVVKFEKFNTQLDLTGAVSYSQKAINQAIQELQQCWLPWQQDQTELRLKQEHLDNVARKKEQELYQQQQQIMQQSSFPVSSSSSVANVGVIDEKQALLDQIERQKQEFERVLREQKLQMEKEYKALEDKKAVDWIKSNDDWRQFFKSSLGLSDEELQNPEIAKVLIERTLTAVHQPDSAPAQSQPSSSSPSQLQQQHQEYQQIAPQAQQPPVFDQQQQFQVPPAQQQPAFDQQQQYQVPPVQQQQYQAPAQQQQYQAPVQQQPAFDQQQQQYQAPPAQQQPTFDQQQQYQAPPAQQQQYQAPVQQQPAFDQQQQQQQQYQAPPAQQQQYQAPVQQQQQQPAFDQQQYQQTPQTLNAEFSAASLRPPPPPPTEEAQPSQPSYSAPAPPLSQSGPPTGGPPPPPPSGGPPPPPPPPPAGGPRPPPAMPSASGPPKPKPQAAMPSIADMINAGTPQLRKVVPTDPADKPPVPSGDPRTNMFAEMKNKKLRATVIQPKQMSEDTSNDLKNILMRTLTKFRPMLKETATDSDEEKDAENW